VTDAPDETPSSDAAQRWYLPTWGERLRLMRWRVIYFLPAVPLLALTFFAPFLLLVWWKLFVFAVALPMSAAVRAAKNAIQLRKEPFCIHCGYDLTSLPERHRCPECGVPFSFAEIDDYRRDPHWFIKRRQMNHALPVSGAMIDAGPKHSAKSRDGT